MPEPAEAKEQALEPSDVKGVKNVQEALAKAAEEQVFLKPSEPAEQGKEEGAKAPEEKAPQGKEEEGKEKEPSKIEPKLFIVDEKGNKKPFVFKADGKEYAPEDIDKVLTWSSLGVHANEKLEDANKKMAEYNAASELIQRLRTAMSEGRLVIDGKVASDGKPKDEGLEEEDEDDYTDPEIKKMQVQLKDANKEIGSLKEYEFKKMIKQQKEVLDSEINKAREKHFGTLVEGDEGTPVGVWKLLAETNPDGSPKYTPEKAAEASHKSILSFVKGFLKSHPEVLDADMLKEIIKGRKDVIDKDEIYLQALKEKESAAPVSGPSHIEADTGKKEKKKYKGVADAMKHFQKDIAENVVAGGKL